MMVDQLSIVMPPAQDPAPMMVRTIPTTAYAPSVLRADQPRPKMSQQASAVTATASTCRVPSSGTVVWIGPASTVRVAEKSVWTAKIGRQVSDHANDCGCDAGERRRQ